MLAPRSMLALLLSTQIPALLGGPAAQTSTPEGSRIVKVGGAHGQPGYTLRVSASGNLGRIEVDDASGSHVQILLCSLLRNELGPTALELAGMDEQFVVNFAIEDLNFDGYPDLKAPREFGAKWGRYCVWLFDPTNRRFMNDGLAEQMELLYNLEADAEHERVLAYTIGPVNPMRDEYRIEGVGKDRPYWPRLIPVRSCFIESASPPFVQVLTDYDQGRPVVKRQRFDLRAVCSSACDCVQPATRP